MSTESPPQRVVPPSRRRDKPILSCNLCRRRKLKCDRQQPCKTCLDRGLSLSCTYTKVPPAGAAKENVHDRIDQLERLVASLMGGQKSNHHIDSNQTNSHASPAEHLPPESSINSPLEDEDPEIVATPDRMKLEEDSTSYTSSGHWSSILDSIADLREQLDAIPATPLSRDPAQPEIIGPELLFGSNRHATQNEILAALPPRPEADILVNVYFNSLAISAAIIHQPTFMREYEIFWTRPFDTPIMFVSLVFSVFCIATRFQHIGDVPGDGFSDPATMSLCAARMDFFREKTVQCMVLANYAKCPPYTVEAFVQYFCTEYLRSPDTQFGTWVVVGMLVRMAFRTGYHRDGSHFPNISTFQAEMRRRVWCMIVQLDLMSSAQVGLPKMIQKSMFDTEVPRHLAEEDLHEHMTELPPARPPTESSVILYNICRTQIMEVYAEILELTSPTTLPPYREVMSLDEKLRKVFRELPPSMTPIKLDELTTNNNNTEHAIRRLYLGLACLKCELTLHRPYLLLGRTDTRYEYSRLLCLDTAMEILDFQQTLERESVPGGKLWTYNWKLWSATWRLSSIVNHDFLLATTVLSLDLDRDLVSPLPPSSGAFPDRIRFKRGQPTRAEIITALVAAFRIWVLAAEKSHEARKVATAVKIILQKANIDPQARPQADMAMPILVADDNPFAAMIQPMNLFPSFNYGMYSPTGQPQRNLGGEEWSDMSFEFPFTSFEQSLRNPYL